MKSGISSFSRWTVGDASLPLNVPIPAVLAVIEGTALAYTEASGEVQITNTITISDADDTNLESAVIQITSSYQNGEDELTFVNQNGITGAWDVSLGKLTLTGTSSLANYQTALRGVKYINSNLDPDINQRTVSFTVNDGDNNSNTETRNISINALVNDPTVAVNTGDSVNEGGTLVFTDAILKANDEDGPIYSLTYHIIKAPKYGTIDSSFTQNDIANGKVTYVHDGSEAPADTFKFVVIDQSNNSSEESEFIITVIGVNDPPVITDVPEITMNEDEEYQILFTNPYNYVTDKDEGTDETTITITVTPNPTGIEGLNEIPAEYTLYQNYPNPFNPSTVIRYGIPTDVENGLGPFRNVSLTIYDILGNEVTTLVNEQQSPGYYERTWNAKNMSSGIYFYVLQAGSFTESRKLILLK